MENSFRKNIENLFIAKFLHPFRNEKWHTPIQSIPLDQYCQEVTDVIAQIHQKPQGLLEQFQRTYATKKICDQNIQWFLATTKKIIQNEIKWIYPGHPHYPKQLYLNEKHASFFAIGNTSILTHKIFTIIGSRKTSSTSKRIAGELGLYINDRNQTLASGGAVGVDIASQLQILKSNTATKNLLVVLPGGVCSIVPKCHERIIQTMTQTGGCVISTPHPFAQTPKFSYILRNHFLVNISETLFVIQANDRSGALSTANYAIEQGTQTTVWNGELNDIRSKGSRKLIGEGAEHFSNAKEFPFLL